MYQLTHVPICAWVRPAVPGFQLGSGLRVMPEASPVPVKPAWPKAQYAPPPGYSISPSPPEVSRMAQKFDSGRLLLTSARNDAAAERTAWLNTKLASVEVLPFWSTYLLPGWLKTQEGGFCRPRPRVTFCPAAW